ncbi:MAG: hypothetical protein ACI4RD_01545 [Kiritimatiellia bacterium]
MKLVNVPERHLPPDFADRLVESVRRRRRSRRLRTAAALASAGILGAVLAGGFCRRENDSRPAETRIAASCPMSTNDTEVTGLLMLGFFRECLRRSKTGKKREED